VYLDRSKTERLLRNNILLLVPGRFSAIVFRPRLRISRSIEIMGLLRAIAGASLLFYSYTKYPHKGGSISEISIVDYAGVKLSGVIGAIQGLIILGPIVMITLLLITKPSAMLRTFIDMWTPVATMVILELLLDATFFCFINIDTSGQRIWHDEGNFPYVLATVWFGVNTVVAGHLGFVHMFNAADAHPYLPSILGILFSLLLVANNSTLRNIAIDFGVQGSTASTSSSFIVGGSLILAVIQAAIFIGIARENGHTFRSGSYPTP